MFLACLFLDKLLQFITKPEQSRSRGAFGRERAKKQNHDFSKTVLNISSQANPDASPVGLRLVGLPVIPCAVWTPKAPKPTSLQLRRISRPIAAVPYARRPTVSSVPQQPISSSSSSSISRPTIAPTVPTAAIISPIPTTSVVRATSVQQAVPPSAVAATTATSAPMLLVPFQMPAGFVPIQQGGPPPPSATIHPNNGNPNNKVRQIFSN